MIELLKKLSSLKLAPLSEDTDLATSILKKELPFKIHEFTSGSEYNGWIIPQKWKVVKAVIYKNNKKIYDGTEHPLGVVGYSTSFKGKVSLSFG